MYNTDLTGAIALVIGSEGEGVSRIVKENVTTLLRSQCMAKFFVKCICSSRNTNV